MAQDLLLCPDCGGIIGATQTTDAGRHCSCFPDVTPAQAPDLADPFASEDPNDTAVMPVPEETRKLCCVCKKDLSRSKRMRDERGYWCYDCHKIDKRARLGPGSPAPVGDTGSGLGASVGSGFGSSSLSAAAVGTSNGSSNAGGRSELKKPQLICPSCARRVTESQMEEYAGELICSRCKREKTQSAGKLSDRFNTHERQREDRKNIRLQLMITLGIVLFGIAAWQWKLFPGQGEGTSQVRDLIAGARVLGLVVLGLILGVMWWAKRNL